MASINKRGNKWQVRICRKNSPAICKTFILFKDAQTWAGYYAWLDHPVCDRAQEDARLLKLIQMSFIGSHGIYGAPRILQDLRERGETCSKHRVARLMRENGIRNC